MNQLEAYLLGKEGEASGTHLMPISPPPSKMAKNNNPTKTIPKTGGVDPRVYLRDVDDTPQSTKTAERYALPSLQMYPLDDYHQVKTASAYFDDWSGEMSPIHRREFCSNLVKRASQLGIKVSSLASKYGSDTFAPDTEVDIALDSRESLLTEPTHKVVLANIRERREDLEPDEFATLLSEFDKLAGIDEHYGREIPDSYFSTYGVKTASDDTVSDTPAGSIVVGNEYVTTADLKSLALTGHATLKSSFGEDFATEFQKDPIAIFNSLPIDQRKMIMRMASGSLHTESSST